jgi:hypothetical protein
VQPASEDLEKEVNKLTNSDPDLKAIIDTIPALVWVALPYAMSGCMIIGNFRFVFVQYCWAALVARKVYGRLHNTNIPPGSRVYSVARPSATSAKRGST